MPHTPFFEPAEETSETGAARPQGAISPTDRERAVLRALLEQLVAAAFRLESAALRIPTRGRAKVARARQTAMYLAHTICGLSLTEVGVIFERDRTTVAHACAVIEDAREDQQFDRAIELLETNARVVHVHAALPAIRDLNAEAPVQ